MTPTQQNLDCSGVEQWLQLHNLLLSYRSKMPTFPKDVWYQIDPRHSEQLAQAAWDAKNLQISPQIGAIADQLLESGSMPDCPQDLLWLFRVRFDPAIDFVGNMMWSRNHLGGSPEWKGFVPFPAMEVRDVARLLLTEWWTFRGSFTFFDRYFFETLVNRRLSQQKT